MRCRSVCARDGNSMNARALTDIQTELNVTCFHNGMDCLVGRVMWDRTRGVKHMSVTTVDMNEIESRGTYVVGFMDVFTKATSDGFGTHTHLRSQIKNTTDTNIESDCINEERSAQSSIAACASNVHSCL